MGDEPIMTERCTSYGRGGAGNMRRPSVVAQAKETLANITENATPSRRRSSTWSMGSNGDRRGSILNVFRKNSAAEGAVEKIEE
ncbi:hypothetical protein EJ04DRAFT_576233 [Polyplosphaeria fusca]|uniref:Uncharacterized protein n=1 Tax=Polyplosphaeria fusca TaxID=682080 RepID=A0A9P4V4F0_9PLEO|nr:hypothetical protein EJ04DRAFT_576233 [Polyplosphaeria fusca]